MSAFVDGTLLRFAQDTFVADLLTNGLGLAAIFNAMFEATDVQLQSVTLGPVMARSYKVPAFESVRSSGTDERIVPDTQRVRKERVLPRFGRLDWVDVAFDAVLSTKVQTLVAPLQSVTVESLEQKLGGVASIADLRTKLLTLYAPSVVDAIFVKLRISTLDDFERQRHLFIELVGAVPPAFDPNDPAARRDYTVSLRVKIAEALTSRARFNLRSFAVVSLSMKRSPIRPPASSASSPMPLSRCSPTRRSPTLRFPARQRPKRRPPSRRCSTQSACSRSSSPEE
jgi:hypothetical protein